jgi:hypothetical protein
MKTSSLKRRFRTSLFVSLYNYFLAGDELHFNQIGDEGVILRLPLDKPVLLFTAFISLSNVPALFFRVIVLIDQDV